MAAFLLVAAACQSQYEALLASHDSDAKYKAAMEYFNNKRYQRAAQLFESLAVLTNGPTTGTRISTRRSPTSRVSWRTTP